MAKCPVCNSDIAEDFGLVTCSSCGSQVMLSIDGESTESPPPPPISADAFAEDQDNQGEHVQPPMAEEISQVLADEVFSEVIEGPSEVVSQNESIASVRPTQRQHPTATTPDMSDVVNFANSEISQGKEGALRYNVFVSGIDTADVRAQVLEALSDARFLWSADDILGQIKNGAVVFRELTAVKSTVLVQRLRPLPVDVKWEQYAIHQN